MKLEGYTPVGGAIQSWAWLETHVKLEGYTPKEVFPSPKSLLETHVKLEGYTPVILGDLWSTINLFDK